MEVIMAKILVADDERDIRDLISITLEFAGHQVITAANGEEAVIEAKKIKPDLILLDVRMPRVDGYEACRQIKEDPNLKEVPVIFLSAKGQNSEISKGLEVGADEYILKPFSPVDLTNKINQILS
jgi:DNA-binding response OmpR family regulator